MRGSSTRRIIGRACREMGRALLLRERRNPALVAQRKREREEGGGGWRESKKRAGPSRLSVQIHLKCELASVRSRQLTNYRPRWHDRTGGQRVGINCTIKGARDAPPGAVAVVARCIRDVVIPRRLRRRREDARVPREGVEPFQPCVFYRDVKRSTPPSGHKISSARSTD